MAIQTREAVAGFIATDPPLTVSENGRARFYARFGQEHFRKEEDGSFTKLETSFHHLVMFGKSAEHAAEQFAKGDNFIAAGTTRTSTYQRDGVNIESEEFVASYIGHDAARTRYEIDHSPRQNAIDASSFAPPSSRSAPTPASMGI